MDTLLYAFTLGYHPYQDDQGLWIATDTGAGDDFAMLITADSEDQLDLLVIEKAYELFDMIIAECPEDESITEYAARFGVKCEQVSDGLTLSITELEHEMDRASRQLSASRGVDVSGAPTTAGAA